MPIAMNNILQNRFFRISILVAAFPVIGIAAIMLSDGDSFGFDFLTGSVIWISLVLGFAASVIWALSPKT